MTTSDGGDDDLAIAKAQLGLDSDQLDDAQDDLDRATGDNRTQIQTELAAHEATMAKYDNEVKNGGEIAVISVTRQGTLARTAEKLVQTEDSGAAHSAGNSGNSQTTWPPDQRTQ